jgi:hypothetical protein
MKLADEVNMAKVQNPAYRRGQKERVIPSKAAHLDNLIAEATVDCYNESEEITGIFTMMEETLAVPFKTTILGMDVTVGKVDLNQAGKIVTVCRRGRDRQRVPILDLPLPEPRPKGAEWIDAYRRWGRWR